MACLTTLLNKKVIHLQWLSSVSRLVILCILSLLIVPGNASARQRPLLHQQQRFAVQKRSAKTISKIPIYPVPQQVVYKKGHVAYNGIHLIGLPDALPGKNIERVLAPYESHTNPTGSPGKPAPRLTVRYTQDPDPGAPPEGYTLNIRPKEILVRYTDPRGAFYAAQTLRQILDYGKSTGQLPLLDIQDYPDIPRRGVVEGFYGTPWQFQDRISQLKFYGAWKINTYIYGPKDDLYHSSPYWREPYPPEQAEKLKSLIRIAGQNEVDFYWAIHPGKDIQWNQSDSLAIIHKLQDMYDLGVRHFAVFFDDISGQGARAEKQAGLLNYIQAAFIDSHQDAGPLIMCPTEYNKLWAAPEPGTYLDLLGRDLDKRIEIMWTGNSVIHDITKEGEQWVNSRIGRKAFVWWNFPVNDYVRNHLLLGPVYGLDRDLQSVVSGLVSNPMDKAEASKVALFSVANFCWNNKAYNPDKSWQAGIREVLPAVADSYRIFAEHNTDPGPSYHQYRRLESSAIQSDVDTLFAKTDLFTAFPVTGISSIDLARLDSVFNQFAPAAKDILTHAADTALVHEIRPWLLHFMSLGEAASAAARLLGAKSSRQAYPYFIQLQKAHSQLVQIDQAYNRNPYQPGIVTGGRHILPWVEKSYYHFAGLFTRLGFEVPETPDQARGRVISSIKNFLELPVQNGVVTGNKPVQVLKLSPVLEVLHLKPGDYIGLSVQSGGFISDQIITTTPSIKAAGYQIQFSRDGKSWQQKKSPDAKQVRIINMTAMPVAFKLDHFEVRLQ